MKEVRVVNYFPSILLFRTSVLLNVPFQRVIGASGLVCPRYRKSVRAGSVSFTGGGVGGG
jgi:hypothetical protein